MAASNKASLVGIASIDNLDLDPVKESLRRDPHHDWSDEILSEVTYLYKTFLFLKLKYPNELVGPTYEIDLMWHAHILCTEKYFKDCNDIFGHYLHHLPIINDEALNEKIDQNTLLLVEKEFPHLFNH